MRVALACNSRWGVGGQGNCLRQAALGFLAHGPLTLYCRGGEEVPPAVALQTLPDGRVSSWVRAIPLLRRRRDWVQVASDVAFDHRVASNLRAGALPPDLFVGVAMHSLFAIREAKRQGARVWLYCLNAWIPFMKAEVAREYGHLREWGGAEIHSHGVRRFVQECEEADAVVVLSHFAARTFADAGFKGRPIYVLPPSIDTDRFRPTPRSADDDSLRILYVGTITPRKGVHYLLEAVAALDPQRFRLLLVGGAATRRMKQLVMEALRTLPVEQAYRDFSRHDPAEVFGRSDVLVLPSVEDGFGLVVLEAMASGVPAITTTQCGASDVVEDGVNGFVVPPRDPVALAERLEWMRAHPAELARMRVAARETALRFSQNAYAGRVSAILYGAAESVDLTM